MKQSILTIESNALIADNIYKMILSGSTDDISKPGQFVNIKLDGMFLRRPISVCDYDENSLTLVYKVVGHGTEVMSEMNKDDKLDILLGLGNGYDTSTSGNRPLLIGGGVGVPPLYNLAKKLVANGKKPVAILGFNTKNDVILTKEFEEAGCEVLVATADGSMGTKGFVTDVLKDISDYTYIYTCGPEPMLKAVYNASATSGQYSFEERMGCGFGACMGCSCETKYGVKRICKDGPVLVKEEIIW